MFPESYLIDQIKSSTVYTDVTLAEDSVVDLIHQPLIEPRIFVGHLGIKLQFPDGVWANGYRELENNEMLLTSIQWICSREDLPTVRTAIKKAYTGFSPYPNDGNFSSLVFMEASVVAKTSTKAWWQEIVGLVMPRIS